MTFKVISSAVLPTIDATSVVVRVVKVPAAGVEPPIADELIATPSTEPPLISALADDEVVTYNNVPFQVHMTNDVQEFGAVGADKDGNLLYEFEIDVEEAI